MIVTLKPYPIEITFLFTADNWEVLANLDKPKSSRNEGKNKLITNTLVFIVSPKLSTHNDGLNRGASTTNLAPMTTEFYPIMEQVRHGRNKLPCRESLAKLKATLSHAVKC
jgi:hypothetical protein